MTIPTVYPSDQGYSSFPATIPPYVGAVMVCLFLVNNRLHHNETPLFSLKHFSMVRTFESSCNSILTHISKNSTGLYFILFFICIYVLLRRKETAHWILVTSAIAMFTIATTDIMYTYYLVFVKLFNVGLSFNDLRPKYWFYVTNK